MKRIVYRLENAEGVGPFYGKRPCMPYLVPHRKPEDMFALLKVPKPAFKAMSRAGMLFGWRTQRHYRRFFGPKGQGACRALGFDQAIYRPTVRLDFPDGQVWFLPDHADSEIVDLLATVVEPLNEIFKRLRPVD